MHRYQSASSQYLYSLNFVVSDDSNEENENKEVSSTKKSTKSKRVRCTNSRDQEPGGLSVKPTRRKSADTEPESDGPNIRTTRRKRKYLLVD